MDRTVSRMVLRITTGMDYIFILLLTLNENRSRHLNTLMYKASRLTLRG